MGHGLTGVRSVGLPPFAETFASSGIAAFVFDYRYFGDSGGSPRYLVDPLQQLDDWAAAVAYARALDGVDGDRFAVWGSSFSGGLVLKVAADHPDVDAIVVQVPAVDGEARGEAFQVGVGRLAGFVVAIVQDLLKSTVSNEAVLLSTFSTAGGGGMIEDDEVRARSGSRSTFRCSRWLRGRIAWRLSPRSRRSPQPMTA